MTWLNIKTRAVKLSRLSPWKAIVQAPSLTIRLRNSSAWGASNSTAF